MAGNDVFLRGVPSDTNPNDVRLYDPTTSDAPVADDGKLFTPVVIDTWQPDEDADPGYLASFEVILCGPLEDTVVVADDTLFQPVIVEYGDDIAAAEYDLQPAFFAIGPPDQDDEIVRPFIVAVDDVAADDAEFCALAALDDAPVADATLFAPLILDDAEKVEEVAEFFTLAPLADTVAAAVNKGRSFWFGI